MATALPIDSEPGRRIALWIEIDDQHLLANGGERSTEIDRGRGFADTAFLVGDRNHARRRGLGNAAGKRDDGRRLRRRLRRQIRMVVHGIASRVKEPRSRIR